MPFEPEFKKHLHSLMVEVLEKTREELEQHKRELIFKAQQTQNAAAMPIAYKEAALFSIELRVSKTINKYIEAVTIWGYSIDAAFEKEMICEFRKLTSGPKQIPSLPMIYKSTLSAVAVQQSFGRERERLAFQLVREGTNRLRELKMKTDQAKRTAAASTTHNTFNGPIGNAFINSSVVQTTNNITITAQILDDIDRLSEGNSELQSAALEIRNAQSQGTIIADKLQKWTTLANTVVGLAEKIHQYYPHIESFLSQFMQ